VPALTGRVGDEAPADTGAQQPVKRQRRDEVAATAAIAFTGGQSRAVV
jgi:hypothetical protein